MLKQRPIVSIHQGQQPNCLPLAVELLGHFQRYRASQAVPNEEVWPLWLKSLYLPYEVRRDVFNASEWGLAIVEALWL